MTGGRRAPSSSVLWLHSQVGFGTSWPQQSQLRGGEGNKINAEKRGKVILAHPHLGSSDSSSSCPCGHPAELWGALVPSVLRELL